MPGPRASLGELPQKISARPQGIFSGNPPQKMGARPQGIFFRKPPQKNGCQAPGHFFGKPPLKMGERPQGILFWRPKTNQKKSKKIRKIPKNIPKDTWEKTKSSLFLDSQDATSKSRSPLTVDPKNPWDLFLGDLLSGGWGYFYRILLYLLPILLFFYCILPYLCCTFRMPCYTFSVFDLILVCMFHTFSAF